MRAATTETGPRTGQSLRSQRTFPSSWDHLLQLRLEPAAIGALVVEPFDDRDVTIGVAGDRDVRIAQHRGFSARRLAPTPDAAGRRAPPQLRPALVFDAGRVENPT